MVACGRPPSSPTMPPLPPLLLLRWRRRVDVDVVVDARDGDGRLRGEAQRLHLRHGVQWAAGRLLTTRRTRLARDGPLKTCEPEKESEAQSRVQPVPMSLGHEK